MWDEDDFEGENEVVEDPSDENEVTSYEFDIDFDTGQLTGEKVTGSRAVAVWVWIALQIERYLYDIFPLDYGCELNTLIGTRYSQAYTKALAKQYVMDCIKPNAHVTGLSDFSCVHTKDGMKIDFTLETDFGDEEVMAIV